MSGQPLHPGSASKLAADVVEILAGVVFFALIVALIFAMGVAEQWSGL